MTDSIYETIKDAKSDLKPKHPRKYIIILHNDASTPFPIVVHALVAHMRLPEDNAMSTMYEAHTTGAAPCGVYPKDIAETMIADAMNCPAVAGTELSFTAEPE